MANVRRRATSRANSSDSDFSIGKDIDIPSPVQGASGTLKKSASDVLASRVS
jgi:hypothetical protein